MQILQKPNDLELNISTLNKLKKMQKELGIQPTSLKSWLKKRLIKERQSNPIEKYGISI